MSFAVAANMWNVACGVTVCRIDVDTETVLDGIISDDDIPRSLIDSNNHSSRAVDCTWVLHGPPNYRVCPIQVFHSQLSTVCIFKLYRLFCLTFDIFFSVIGN